MNDWYQVLGVPPTATAEEIEAAYRRLVPLERDPKETEDQAEERRLREYAYGVLRDPDARARYDAERATEAPRQIPAAAPARPRQGGVPLGPVVAAFLILAAIAAVAALILYVALDDDGSERYPARSDSFYDLESMRLRNGDMPAGFEWTNSIEFNNDEWVRLFFSQEDLEDPELIQGELEAKRRELTAEGRLRNLLSIYESDRLGRTLGIFSISTLYTDNEAASASLTLYCGLPVDRRQNLELRPLRLPEVGDQSSGFISEGVMSSALYSETTFCFRTGRVVHAISLASLPGVEDIGLAVRLAKQMEGRVQAFYRGEAEPLED